jgi:hypothetical protein
MAITGSLGRDLELFHILFRKYCTEVVIFYQRQEQTVGRLRPDSWLLYGTRTTIYNQISTFTVIFYSINTMANETNYVQRLASLIITK